MVNNRVVEKGALSDCFKPSLSSGCLGSVQALTSGKLYLRLLDHYLFSFLWLSTKQCEEVIN